MRKNVLLQYLPVSGTSVGRIIFLIWSMLCKSGDKPEKQISAWLTLT